MTEDDTMHFTDDPTTNDDLAARAIRESLPQVDHDAAARIAQRINDGMQERDRVAARSAAPQTRDTRQGRRGGRRLGALRPALATGAVMVAGAIALLAPGTDRDGRGLGPELAAAATLEAAGEQALDASWTPLAAGEYHYTVNSWTNPNRRVEFVEHRWLAADGTGVREVRERSLQPAGSVYWTPALDCRTVNSVPSPMTRQETEPAGAARPRCWEDAGVLSGAFGEIVDAPPEGALVDGVDVYGAVLEDDLVWGSTVTEAPGPPPGATETTGEDGSMVVEVGPVSEQAPARMPRETTWVQVRAGEHVTFRGPLLTGPNPVLGALAWGIAFEYDADEVPTDADELLAMLRAKASDALAGTPEAGTASAVMPGSVDQAVVTMATDLLSSAPLSPQQRRAVFGALGTLATEAGATVERGVELPGGGERAARIRFVEQLPEATGDAKPIAFQSDIYLDEGTSELRAIAFGSEGSPAHVTSWERSQRVTTAAVPTNARG